MSVPALSLLIMAKKSPPRMLQVKRTAFISPGLKRITLSGQELEGFPENSSARHIKVFFPLPGQQKPVMPTFKHGRPVWEDPTLKPVTRAYSISEYDHLKKELSIDFVMHLKGPASIWASEAVEGDYLAVAGPGEAGSFLREGEFYLLAGDLSALPAMRVLINGLSPDSKGVAIIEIESLTHIIDLGRIPSKFKISWILNTKNLNFLLSEKVKQMDWPEADVSAWVAGESNNVLEIRNFLKSKGLKPGQYYGIPYWKRGENEDEYHQERHDIMDGKK